MEGKEKDLNHEEMKEVSGGENAPDGNLGFNTADLYGLNMPLGSVRKPDDSNLQ